MRVLMFGRGVISTIYGQALAVAGHEVEFYVRPGRIADHGDQVQMDLVDGRRGLAGKRVLSTFGPRMRESLTQDDAFDLVIVSVGHHRLSEAMQFLQPRIGTTTVLTFGNIWDEPATAVAPLSPEQVVFGFPGAGGGLDEDAVLHGALLRSVTIGVSGPSPTARELTVQAVFRGAGLGVTREQDMRGWLWLHFASDAGMLAQARKSGSLANMIGDRRAFTAALLGAGELIPVIVQRGVDLSLHRGMLTPFRMPRVMASVMAVTTKRLPIARASLAAHTDADTAEARAVLRDALASASELDVRTPHLAH